MELINGIEHVKKHPRFYLGVDEPSGPVIAERVVGTLLLLGLERVTVASQTGWYAVFGNKKWLPADHGERSRLFNEVVPFPEAGPNSFRPEILVGAFADAAGIWEPSGWMNLSASRPGWLDRPGVCPAEAKQGIVFRLRRG